MFDFINKNLGNKIMAAVTISIVLVMGVEILVRIYFGTRDRIELMETLVADLAISTYSGIKYPMSVGDSDAVEKVLAAVRQKMAGVEVFICDDDQRIVWSTHAEKIHTKISDSIASKMPLLALNEMLRSGLAAQESLEDSVEGERYRVTILPILNNPDCFHCHGSQKKVIGGMVIRTNAEHILRTVANARNRTIVTAIIGISAIIILINILVGKFIRRPIEKLADTAKRFAEGDMSVSIPVTTNDEIGVLGSMFNYMVQSIASFSKKLELEVEDKTNLLDERTVLINCLDRANKQLRDLDLLKSRFLANMSHELRTPMNSIIGYTDLLLDEVDGVMNEEQKKSLQKITTNAKHLLNLINDILDLSRIEAGKAELDVVEFRLKDIIDSIRPIFEPLIAQKGLSFKVDCPENLPAAYGDTDKFRQVLINLVGNAIKFTESGGIAINCKISQRGVKKGAPPIFAEVWVEDTGIGIKENDLAKIFNKFVQADLSIMRQYEGTGLGLSIAKQLVAMHKGIIWATSVLGRGSQFCFTVPLQADIPRCPEIPVVEFSMAEALADSYNMAVDIFLRDPYHGGKIMRCWEYVHCGETGCPAYRSAEPRCWLILGTHCEGLRIAAYPEKTSFCRNCEVIKKLVLPLAISDGSS